VKLGDDRVQRILEVGRPLDKHGSNNWALSRTQALAAIAAIEREGLLLLGGDVWLQSGALFSPTGDSWHFDPMTDEARDRNVTIAANAAKAYVADYPERDDGIVYFELVVQGSGKISD
jgi:hypothetical protein